MLLRMIKIKGLRQTEYGAATPTAPGVTQLGVGQVTLTVRTDSPMDQDTVCHVRLSVKEAIELGERLIRQAQEAATMALAENTKPKE